MGENGMEERVLEGLRGGKEGMGVGMRLNVL